MKKSEELLQKARAYLIDRIDSAVIHEQEFVTFQELMLSEGKSERDFSVKAWTLMDQAIQYPFDEFAYFAKDEVTDDPLTIQSDELFLGFLSCLADVIEEEGLSYDEINALPLGFKIAYYLVPWDEAGGFMMWLINESPQEVDFVKQVSKVYLLAGLGKENKAIVKAMKYLEPDSSEFDKDKALIAYSYVHGHMENRVDKRLEKICDLILNRKKRSQLFS